VADISQQPFDLAVQRNLESGSTPRVLRQSIRHHYITSGVWLAGGGTPLVSVLSPMVPAFIVGLVFVGAGVALVTNQMHVADRLAAFSRQFPWWLKPTGADDPFTGRLAGIVLMITGIVLAAIGVKSFL
jgi:hypothetical protein